MKSPLDLPKKWLKLNGVQLAVVDLALDLRADRATWPSSLLAD